MRDRTVSHAASMLALLIAFLGLAAPAGAQVPPAPNAAPTPPPVTPPGAIEVPPATPPPPAVVYVYPPPPAYAYPRDGYDSPRRAPQSLRYDGGPVPAGYHLETRQRRGLIISGALLTGVPWVLGLSVAAGQSFPNHTGWLALPALGPWVTLASRHDSSCPDRSDACVVVDPLTRTLLVFDGLMQTTGAVLFVLGVSSPYQVVTRDFVGSVRFTPAPIGRQGYGGFLTGEF